MDQGVSDFTPNHGQEQPLQQQTTVSLPGAEFPNNKLVKWINHLMDWMSACGHDLKLSLPTIAAIGTQSVGKSSVLEHLAGREFFPRGPGMVTRCPLVLQMTRIAPGQEAYMKFSQPSDEKHYTKDEEVQAAIMRFTAKMTDGEKCITSQPINLQLYSPDVLDLTLVDLPGLVRTATHDQPEDIAEQVRDLVKSYIQDENTIILAVSQANFDIAGSESLELARKVDPEGKRTIGVLTKLDQVRPHDVAQVVRVLENEQIPLVLGYVGVVNPEIDVSSQDRRARPTIAKMRKKEDDILQKFFPAIAGKHGTKVLQEKLAKEFARHIQEKAPLVKIQLEAKRSDVAAQLRSYGISPNAPVCSEEESLEQAKTSMWGCIRQFAKDLTAVQGFSENVDDHEKSYGPMMAQLFEDIAEEIQRVDKPSFDYVAVLTTNILSVNQAVFAPQQVLNKAAKLMATEKYDRPILAGLDKFVSLMQECLWSKLSAAASYPTLQNKVYELMAAKLEKNKVDCERYLLKFLQNEGSYPNFNHPTFQQRIRGRQFEIGGSDKRTDSIASGDEFLDSDNAAGDGSSDSEADHDGEESNGGEQPRVKWSNNVSRYAKQSMRLLSHYLAVMEVAIVDQVRKAFLVCILDETVKYAQDEILREAALHESQVGALMAESEERKAAISLLQRQYESIKKGLDEVRKVGW